MISCGKKDKDILRYINNHPRERFNIKAYHRLTGIPRTTIKDALDRLIMKGLIEHPCYGSYLITHKGKTLIEVVSGGIGYVRRECRDEVSNLSTHYSKYKLEITNKKDFNEGAIDNICENWKINNLPNLKQYFLYYNDATIIINPKQVIIRIHDIIAELDDMDIERLSLAMKYVTILESIGVYGDSLKLEDAHYARMESYLSETLSKIDNRYFIDLGDGRKFWIDNSNDKNEDETNNIDIRRRLDNLIKDVSNSDFRYKDVEEMKEIVGFLLQMETIRKLSIPLPQPIDKNIPSRDYIG